MSASGWRDSIGEFGPADASLGTFEPGPPLLDSGWKDFVSRSVTNRVISGTEVEGLVGTPETVRTMSGIELGYRDNRISQMYRVWTYPNNGRIIFAADGSITDIEPPGSTAIQSPGN